MADQQKVHPVTPDLEARNPSIAPLMPRGTSKSDQTEPTDHLHDQNYPPFKRTIPVMHSKPPKKRSCFCRCLCWTLSLLLLLILIIGIVFGIIFLVFRPKLPKYSIDRLQITQFNLNGSNLDATFDVTVKAWNPNKRIGIYYEGGSRMSVFYTGTKLCEGSLPKFYQGHRNTTVLVVALTGRTEDANGLITSLQTEQQNNGYIPLKLRVKQPVRVKLGKLKLMKVKFLVRCRLDVDSVSAGNNVIIRNSSCKFRFRL